MLFYACMRALCLYESLLHKSFAPINFNTIFPIFPIFQIAESPSTKAEASQEEPQTSLTLESEEPLNGEEVSQEAQRESQA